MKKFAKKALAGALSLAMMLGVTAVVDPATADAKVKVKKVTVTSPSGKTAYIAKGKKIKLTATVKVAPNKKANKKVTYKSANKKIAKVNSKGQVKGVRAGSTKITVTSKKNSKKKATIKVVVKKAAVKKVKLNKKTASVAVGGKVKLKATVSPTKNVSKKIQWTSSRKKVATVSSKGVVKGKKEGTATITAKAADGSGKKATCKVTVGAGIKSMSVENTRVLKVTLSSKATLKAADFAVQQRSNPKRKYTTTKEIDQVTTPDGGKTWLVLVSSGYSFSNDTYVQTTINALKGEKSSEIYVEKIPEFEYSVKDTVERVTGRVGRAYGSSWSIDVWDQTVGTVKYTVSDLPAGLKAYYNANKTSVSVRGRFQSVSNGTSKATLTAVDEKGNTFKKTYEFYVGSDDQIVGSFLGDTRLSYTADNPATTIDESSTDSYFGTEGIESFGNGVIVGGSGNYNYEISGLPSGLEQEVDTDDNDTPDVETDDVVYATGNVKHTYVKGQYVGDQYQPGYSAAVPAASAVVTVKVTDKVNPAVTAVFSFPMNITDGVTLTGKVTDMKGAGAHLANVGGFSKADAYSRYERVPTAETYPDGTYKVRVIPADYTLYSAWDGISYDYSTNNNIAGNYTKDLKLPLYRVDIATNIPNAAAYREVSLVLYDQNGKAWSVETNSSVEDIKTRDYKMFTYLKAGTYEVSNARSNSANSVMAYPATALVKDAVTQEVYLNEYDAQNNPLGSKFVLSGSFTVADSMTATLAGTPWNPDDPNNNNDWYDYDD